MNCRIPIYIGKNRCTGVILLTRPLIHSSALADITFITARQLGDLSCSFHRKSFFIGGKADRPQIIKGIDRLIFLSGFVRQYKLFMAIWRLLPANGYLERQMSVKIWVKNHADKLLPKEYDYFPRQDAILPQHPKETI